MSFLSALARVSMMFLLFVAPASAMPGPDETAFTLDSQISISFDGGPAGPQSFTLDPIPLGPPSLDGTSSGIDCLAGVCDIQNQDWVVFQVSVLSGNLGELTLALLDSFAGALPALGLGYFLEGGPTQPSYSGSLADIDGPQFLFAPGITLQTLPLFVAFADFSLPQLPQAPFDVFGPGAVQFMLAPFGSGSIGSGSGNFATPINVIPEPGTALLLGLGIAALAVRRGRQHG